MTISVPIINGDVIAAWCNLDINVLIHQANCLNVMGGGIAGKLARLFPDLLKADRDYPIAVGDKERLGRFSYWQDARGCMIFNAYGQFGFARHKYFTGKNLFGTNYKALETALTDIAELLDSAPNAEHISVGIPYKIGCGLGGGDWAVVYEIINRVFAGKKIEAFVFKLDAA